MGKVGAIQDLVRGIEKLIPKNETISQVKETVVLNNGGRVTVDSLLKRVFMFLSDSEWESADEYCEKVLDIDPENGQAYLGKLMVDLKIKNQTDFMDVKVDYGNNKNYRKVLVFGDVNTKTKLKDILENKIKAEIAEKERMEAGARAKKQEELAIQAEKQRIIDQRKRNGLCQHCGGKFKGFLVQKCSICGKIIDYIVE